MKYEMFKLTPEMTEDVMLEKLMAIENTELRRAVARCLWFDVADQVSHWDRIKTLAELTRLDGQESFSIEMEREAMMAIGFTERAIDSHTRMCEAYRRRNVNELQRIMEERRVQYQPRLFGVVV